MKEVIEIDSEHSSWFQEMEPGDYVFRLTAVYDECESDYALTETGDDYLLISMTSVPENTDEELLTITKVYTLNGQIVRNANLEELSRGVYIVQGLTKNGKPITRKLTIGLKTKTAG